MTFEIETENGNYFYAGEEACQQAAGMSSYQQMEYVQEEVKNNSEWTTCDAWEDDAVQTGIAIDCLFRKGEISLEQAVALYIQAYLDV